MEKKSIKKAQKTVVPEEEAKVTVEPENRGTKGAGTKIDALIELGRAGAGFRADRAHIRPL